MSHTNPPLELPTVESSEVLFEGFGQLRRDQLRLPNQQLYPYYMFITTAEAVMVVATTDEGKVVINQEYRHPTKQVLLGLPGGLIEGGEDPLVGAQRELMEETGYTADSFELMGSAYPFPGASSQKVLFVHGKRAKKVAEPQLEPAEILQSTLMTEEELMEKIQKGAPVDGALCVALHYYRYHQSASSD